MEIKFGVDIIEIDRIKDSIENLGDKFINNIYTEEEIKYCEGKENQKYQHYAARFAAKEAAFKAISQFLENKYELSWKDYEVITDKDGKPTLNLKLIQLKDVISIDLSISHCKQYAIASVALLCK